jgi:hypothetical protein
MSLFELICSVDELRRILNDKDAYNSFFNSLEQVKTQNNVSTQNTLLTMIYFGDSFLGTMFYSVLFLISIVMLLLIFR